MSKFLMPKAWSPKSQTKKNNWSTVRSTLSHAIHEFQLASAGVLGVAQGTAQSHGEEGENQWVLAHQLHLRWLDKYGNPHGKHGETHANSTSSTIFMKKTWSNMIDSPLLWIFQRDHGFMVHVPLPRRILPELLSQGKRNYIEFLALPGNQTWLASWKIP